MKLQLGTTGREYEDDQQRSCEDNVNILSTGKPPGGEKTVKTVVFVS